MASADLNPLLEIEAVTGWVIGSQGSTADRLMVQVSCKTREHEYFELRLPLPEAMKMLRVLQDIQEKTGAAVPPSSG